MGSKVLPEVLTLQSTCMLRCCAVNLLTSCFGWSPDTSKNGTQILSCKKLTETTTSFFNLLVPPLSGCTTLGIAKPSPSTHPGHAAEVTSDLCTVSTHAQGPNALTQCPPTRRMEPNCLVGRRPIRICLKAVAPHISLKRLEWKEKSATKQTSYGESHFDAIPPLAQIDGDGVPLRPYRRPITN